MPTATKERLKDLQERLNTKVADIERIAASFTEEAEGKFVVSTEQAADYRKAIDEANEIKSLIEAERGADAIRAFANAPAGASIGAAAAATDTGQLIESKTLSGLWLASDAYADMKNSGFRQFGQTATFERGINTFQRLNEVKDVYTALGGTIPINGIGTAQNLGFTERALRPGRVRDLFPADTTQANLLYGVRETGYLNRARPVAERTAADGVSPPTGGPTDVFGLKPKSEITLTPYQIPVVTIAHIMYVHKNVLDDDKRMRGILDRDMIDGVKMAEDEQILYGTGLGEEMTGIVNTPGVQQYAGVAGEKKSTQVRRAATRAILAYFPPNGVVVHPFDWEDLELETDDNGAYTIAISVAVGGEKRLWRMNVVDTPAIIEGQYLLGSFGLAAKFFDREAVSVQVSTENRDLFERNTVTLRCEERGALDVSRPEAMVVGQFAA